MNSSQCYKLLGLDEGASINQVKEAYRKLALEYHPDKNISAKDGEKFKIISEAYHTLREKNNSYVRLNHRNEHYIKNQQNRKKGFVAWMDLFYSEMHYMCIRCAKNVYLNYLKYEPIFLEHYHKIKKNMFITIHSIMEFFPYNRIKILFRIITKSTSILEKTITKTIRW